MHHVYSTLAMDIARDRTREAAQWRLAREARQGRPSHRRPSRTLIDRLRAVFGEEPRQRLIGPTFTPGPSDCA
jgi:hypothetical protein